MFSAILEMVRRVAAAVLESGACKKRKTEESEAAAASSSCVPASGGSSTTSASSVTTATPPRLDNSSAAPTPEDFTSRERTSPKSTSPKSATKSTMADDHDSVLKSLTYENDDGDSFSYHSHVLLDEERRERYAQWSAELGSGAGAAVYSVSACSSSASTATGPDKEFIVKVSNGAGELVNVCCGITAEEVPPSELVEYCFEEPCAEWKLAQATREALQGYS